MLLVLGRGTAVSLGDAAPFLAIAYTATRSLWLPIGLHFAWNFTESGVFGTAVSGADGEHGLLRTVLSGPEVLTGGTFGPEASLFRCCAARSRRCGTSATRSSSLRADQFTSGAPGILPPGQALWSCVTATSSWYTRA